MLVFLVLVNHDKLMQEGILFSLIPGMKSIQGLFSEDCNKLSQSNREGMIHIKMVCGDQSDASGGDD